MQFLERIRTTYHPLSRLRSHPATARALSAMDVPIWRRPAGATRPVRMRLVQHFTYHAVRQGPEPEVAALMTAVVRRLPVETFVDIGANFGYYSWLLRDVSKGPLTVHMFEPVPGNVQLVEATLRRYPQDVTTLHAVALGAEEGTMPFYVDPASAHRGSLVDQPFLEGEVPVPVRRLDDELDLSSLPGRILAKIDVEGAEEMVMSGAHDFLGLEPIVLLECYCDADGASAAETLAALPGYRMLDAETGRAPSAETANWLAVPAWVSAADLAAVIADRDGALAG